MDATREFKLTEVKKYWRCISQVKTLLHWLHNWIPLLATFIRHSQRVYNNKKVTQSISIRQDIDPE